MTSSIHPLSTVSSAHRSCHPPLTICDGLPSPAASFRRPRWPARSTRSASCRPTRSARRPAPRTSRCATASRGYRAGDLERRYASLAVEEDFFVNYGFVTSAVHRLMHPRAGGARAPLVAARRAARAARSWRSCARAATVHPREVDSHFAHGTRDELLGRLLQRHDPPARCSCTTAACCASCGATPASASTASQRGDAAARATRPSARRAHRRAGRRRRAQVRAAARPEPVDLVARLRYAVPQWRRELKPALQRARQRLATRASTASSGTGRRTRRLGAAAPPTIGAPAGARSIRSSGTAAASRCSGAGPTASRPTRPSEAHARLLRAAAAVARPRHRLGQHLGQERDLAAPTSATSAGGPRASGRSSARSRKNSSGCGCSSGCA